MKHVYIIFKPFQHDFRPYNSCLYKKILQSTPHLHWNKSLDTFYSFGRRQPKAYVSGGFYNRGSTHRIFRAAPGYKNLRFGT